MKTISIIRSNFKFFTWTTNNISLSMVNITDGGSHHPLQQRFYSLQLDENEILFVIAKKTLNHILSTMVSHQPSNRVMLAEV